MPGSQTYAGASSVREEAGPEVDTGSITLVWLVRHGETAWNAAGRLQGRTDVPLGEAGVAQAQATARAAKADPLALKLGGWRSIYTSPLIRAKATATIIGRELGLRPIADEAWVERSFGILEGRTREELEREYPDWWEREEEIPGLESASELRARARKALERLVRRHPGEAIIVVSHGACLNALISDVSGMPRAGRPRLANGSYSVLLKAAGEWSVQAANVTEHLTPSPDRIP